MDAVTTQKVPLSIHPSIHPSGSPSQDTHVFQVSLQPNVHVFGPWEETREPWTQTLHGTQNHLPMGQNGTTVLPKYIRFSNQEN